MFVFDLTKNHFNLATGAKVQIDIKNKYKKCLLNRIIKVNAVAG
jgi:hypothetical protein